MANTRVIKHNNAILKFIRESINKGDYDNCWIKIRVDKNSKIAITKLEQDLVVEEENQSL